MSVAMQGNPNLVAETYGAPDDPPPSPVRALTQRRDAQRPVHTEPQLPSPRGPISHAVIKALSRPPGRLRVPHVRTNEVLTDEDVQLALYCCYELHYRGFAHVSDEWEWNPGLLELRSELEQAFERSLRLALPNESGIAPEEVSDILWQLTRGNGFSLSGWLQEHGTRPHAREIAVHRSGYQLKEADPHTWAIPRLNGRAKAAIVTIQSDEYGGGAAAAMHSSLFANAMTALGLDPTYGAYLDRLPAVSLATTNLISMFGLHRRLRGALVGHLASFEMNSVGPMARYSAWLESLGVPESGRRFYDVHVKADEEHQYIAVDDLVGGLLEVEPDQAGAVLFGARAVELVERTFADHVVSAWRNNRTSLWTP
jgi:Iron-containing redox enzyme